MISESPMKQTNSALFHLGIALGVAALVMGGEYYFRHYVLFWMPAVGSLIVNDMISLLLIYGLLLFGIGRLMKTNWRAELAGLWQAAQESARSWNFTIWFILLVLSILILPYFDKIFWGRFALPMVINRYRSPILWFGSWAPMLKAIALILVNGIFVPIAEEFLWRGVIQPHLLRVLPPPLAIGITAVLFSFKHVLVDASWGRFLSLTAFGIICGIVAWRKSWKNSAVLHIFVNSIATIVGLIRGTE